jgi:membrane-associated phospholipid phosphatase
MEEAFKLLRVFVLAVLSIVLAYFFCDRQIVWFLVLHHSHNWIFLKWMANDIVIAIHICIILYYFYVLSRLISTKLTMFERKLLWVCNTAVVSIFIKDNLKCFFSRYWPATFINNNPSLIQNNMYGFNWCKGSELYASFPSGHATFIVAVCASLDYFFPRYRFLYIVLVAVVILGQLGMYYHYLSDLIAGAFLGYLMAFALRRSFPS